MDQLQIDYIEAKQDARKSLIYSTIWLLFLLLISFIIKFDARQDALVDTPPLRSDEVIEEFQIDNVTLDDVSGGSRGGGTPGSGRIAPPAEQTERVSTAAQSDFTHNSGNSNNHNSPNATNASSTTQSINYFGSGGSGRGDGPGNGPFGGPGNGIEGDGPGTSRGSGKGRVRLNNVSLPNYELDFECRIMFKLQVDSDGKVVGVRTVKSVTTCVEDRIINDIKERIKREVKCNKDPGASLVEMDYTIKLVPRG